MGWQESCLDWLRVAMREWRAGNLRVAVIAAYTSASQACEEYMRRKGHLRDSQFFNFSIGIDRLQKEGVIKDSDLRKLQELENGRNQAAHLPYTAPLKKHVREMISCAETLLIGLHLDIHRLWQATLDGVFYSTFWNRAEVIRLGRFESDQLGLSVLCPTDWELHETANSLSFSLPTLGWYALHEHESSRTVQEYLDRFPSDTGEFPSLRFDPKVMTFRRCASNTNIDLHDIVRMDLAHDLKLGNLRFHARHIVELGGRKITIVPYHEEEQFWNGDIIFYEIPQSESIVLAFHQLTGYGDAWRPMCLDIVRSIEVRQSRGLHPVFAIETIFGQHFAPLFAKNPNCRLTLNEFGEPLTLTESDGKHVDAHFMLRDGCRTIVGLVEFASSIIPYKLQRWKRLDKFCDEVWIYIPTAFADEVREYRHLIGDKTVLFGFSSADNDHITVQRLEM